MKHEKLTLKELLEPPFRINVRNEICAKESSLVSLSFANFSPFIKNEETKRLGLDFFDYIVQAINNEWERQHGEPKRWQYNQLETDCMYYCPDCKVGNDDLLEANFCFRCGVKLNPPERKE